MNMTRKLDTLNIQRLILISLNVYWYHCSSPLIRKGIENLEPRIGYTALEPVLQIWFLLFLNSLVYLAL